MAELNQILAPYQKSNVRHSLFQLANTIIPYIVLWVLMVFSLKISYALTLALAVLAALFLVRIFIFFHDCGHNSFFPSTKWNKRVGFWLGVLTFTPSEQWWHSHAIHHATSGNLDKRGHGDVTTLTLEEYIQSKWPTKMGYAFFRHPLVMFGLGPIAMFVLMARFPIPNYGRRQTLNVILTDLAIVVLAAVVSLVIGFKAYLMIQLPVTWIAGAMGIYLFYLQHQFEETYWERDEEWNYVASALLGASFYMLPPVLQWFTGSIGYHHIHHLSPRIPNYNLGRAHNNSPLIQKWARKIELFEGFHTTKLKVYNEPIKDMTDFSGVKPEKKRSYGQVYRKRQQNHQLGELDNQAEDVAGDSVQA
ncbi:MAG TPA: fatty acid desaturase [Anaerolineaceae bacterium]|nr:fatty acid desaturase [Anaerolineaceae bacterium]